MHQAPADSSCGDVRHKVAHRLVQKCRRVREHPPPPWFARIAHNDGSTRRMREALSGHDALSSRPPFGLFSPFSTRLSNLASLSPPFTPPPASTPHRFALHDFMLSCVSIL